MAMMTSLLTVLNTQLSEAFLPGYPKLRPTVPYAEITSKRMGKTLNACEISHRKDWKMGEKNTYPILLVLDVLRLGDADDKQSQKDIPQIEGQLFAQMCTDIRRGRSVVVVLLIAGINAQGLFFVDIRSTNRNRDGEDGDVHHDCDPSAWAIHHQESFHSPMYET